MEKLKGFCTKKVIKTVRLEHNNYNQELNKLLRNYSVTPHSTMRVAPAMALFGRPMKTKLPELMIPCSDPGIHEPDRTAKAKIKKHANHNMKLSTAAEVNVICKLHTVLHIVRN